MAGPMRNNPLDGGHRAKVADPRTVAAVAKTEPATSNNFEYDDNEWDIGIGDLIIDLDADIEKTNEKNGGGAAAAGAAVVGGGAGGGGMASAVGGGAGGGGKGGKMAVEHSATVDKGLKMKIKRTKPGTKTSEAKHEIVKSGELNGEAAPGAVDGGGKGKHPLPASGAVGVSGGGGGAGGGGGGGSKRGSSGGHRRDKARDKHGADKATAKPPGSPGSATTTVATPASSSSSSSAAAAAAAVTTVPVSVPVPPPVVVPDVNGVVRTPVSSALLGPAQQASPQVSLPQQQQQPQQQQPQQPQQSQQQQPPQQQQQQQQQHQQQQQQQQQQQSTQQTPQQPQQRLVFPVSSGPGPPNAPGPPANSPAMKMEIPSTPDPVLDQTSVSDDETLSPPAKKAKTEPKVKAVEPKDMLDVCVGTSVGTITEPDCLGPCEPGTSVTLEGIVWHETEGGVLVVNVTWRGKTYVGTLLDCTRHDWAPPRFCDSPTSDLDARLPKGRGKRGRAAANSSPSSDLSNFTETRSSVHSKLRNGSGKGRRGGSTSGSPTPFVPPRPEPSGKRKGRTPEDEAQSPTSNGKKSRAASNPPSSTPNSNSPPSSPILLECPEPNCCKKYKHINGLKYHQSHAHGSMEDEDTKDAASMSENDESNVEAPSPATPVKSPEKVPEPTVTRPSTPVAQVPQQKEDTTPSPPSQPIVAPPSPPMVPVVVQQPIPEQQPPPCRPVTPSPPPPQPAPPPVQVQTPTSLPPPTPPEMVPPGPLPSPEIKTVVKPGVLRYGPPVEEYSANGVYCANKAVLAPLPATVVSSCSPVSTIRTVSVAVASSQPQQQMSPQPSPVPVQQSMPSVPQLQPMPLPLIQLPQAVKAPPPQFKVKPTAALMPDDKKERSKLSSHKKKSRKSPAGSPHPQPEQPAFGLDTTGRDDVQSPAYSDISDDAAPVLDSEMGDVKGKAPGTDKKTEVGQGPSPHAMPHYGMYPFHYGQPPYLVPSVQQHDGKPKEPCEKVLDGKLGDKEKKDTSSEYSQKLLQQHYYPYGYVSGYPYNLEPTYPVTVVPSDDKSKDLLGKDDKSPSPIDQHMKPMPHIPSPIQVPNPAKVKMEPGLGMKEKHQNENHQILKESIEMKSQMSSYMYSRQQQHQQHQHQQQQQEDLRRYYLYPEQQRRKESQGIVEQVQKPLTIPSKPTLPSPSHKHKDKVQEEKKEEKIVKQEGVKPTMETQGPPPPPTSQYAYIHPSYMQSPHYGALPFDPGHPMYRSINPMLVPGPYGANPYLHPQLPRYHAPEDLSRPPSGPTKALDLLQHHASQYYSNHKIHELQERALKSPTPKAAVASASPSGVVGGSNVTGAPGPVVGPQGHSPVVQGGPTAIPTSGKQQSQGIVGDGKEARSPPPQRHVHTHHHTHVGLGYPILASQYPAPYGAAVLATQQAAAVAATVINPYPPK